MDEKAISDEDQRPIYDGTDEESMESTTRADDGAALRLVKCPVPCSKVVVQADRSSGS